MLDEDGNLDPTLKTILVGILLLAIAKLFWSWMTGPAADWFTLDFPHWFATTIWGPIAGHPWWSVMIGAAAVTLVGALTARRRAAHHYIVVPDDDEEPVHTYRMRELDAMGADEFEDACAALLARDGFHEARRVGRAGDLGADIEAWDSAGRKVVGQCKHYRNPVGSQDLQRFNGTARQVHGADFQVFIALNGFTQPAVDFARSQSILLVGRAELERWAHGEGLYEVLSGQLAGVD